MLEIQSNGNQSGENGVVQWSSQTTKAVGYVDTGQEFSSEDEANEEEGRSCCSANGQLLVGNGGGQGSLPILENGIHMYGQRTVSGDKVVRALESARDRYQEELLQLKDLARGISLVIEKQVGELDEFEANGQFELEILDTRAPDQAGKFIDRRVESLEKITHEKYNVGEELEEQRNSCTELQRLLEQERREKMEAQNYINILNETVTAALEGEKFLLEQHRHVLADQHVLAAKLRTISDMRLAGLIEHSQELETVCDSVQQREEVWALRNKVWVYGLWTLVRLILFCSAMLTFLTRITKAGHIFAPT